MPKMWPYGHRQGRVTQYEKRGDSKISILNEVSQNWKKNTQLKNSKLHTTMQRKMSAKPI